MIRVEITLRDDCPKDEKTKKFKFRFKGEECLMESKLLIFAIEEIDDIIKYKDELSQAKWYKIDGVNLPEAGDLL